ncbi:hypothetical protein OFC21_28755, partial [Escherichia coli]|nr:hypothetical protein [Escherichia coli]
RKLFIPNIFAGGFFFLLSSSPEEAFPLIITGEEAREKVGSLSLNNSIISVHAKSDLPAHIIT